MLAAGLVPGKVPAPAVRLDPLGRREEIRVTTLIQGVASGEGGGSTGWEWDPQHAVTATRTVDAGRANAEVSGVHGGQDVDHVADVHVYIVTRPRGQKLEVLRSRSY